MGIAWGYYALFALIIFWFLQHNAQTDNIISVAPTKHAVRLPRSLWYLLQGGAALLIIVVTGIVALTSVPDNHVRLDFLAVAPSGQAAQGEAILLRLAK